MITALALLNACFECGVALDNDGSIHQRGGPPLSRAALEQLSRYAVDLSGAGASSSGESSVHGVLAPSDLPAFWDTVTSGGVVGVSSVSDAIAFSADGRHVEVLPVGIPPETRAPAVALALELETVGWGEPALANSRDLSVAFSVLVQAGAFQGARTTASEALATARGQPVTPPPASNLGRVIREARAVHELASIVDGRVNDLGLESVVALEEQVARILRRATDEGILVDREHLETLVMQAESTFEYHEARVRKVLGVSINSPDLLAELDAHGCSVASLRGVDLAPLREEFRVIDDIMRARTAHALMSNFGRPWLSAVGSSSDGRVHPTFKGNGETGRISSTTPNIMGVPRQARVRATIVAGSGRSLLEADYSASQLRIVAHYCGVEMLRQLFEGDEDLHAWAASKYFDVSPSEITATQRAFGKMANFAPLYGASAKRIAEIGRSDYDLHLHVSEVEALMGVFFESFPEIRDWHEMEAATPTKNVITPLGRRIVLSEFGYNSRLAAPIQAIEADAIKTAMVCLDAPVRARGGRLLTPINDALLYEVPDEEVVELARMVEAEMTRALRSMISVPVRVDVMSGKDWGSMRRV